MEKEITSTEKIKNGEYILKEGTWAFYAYVMRSGKAKVIKNIHGKPVQVGILNKGDIFGEMTFLGGVKRTASVVADGDVEVGLIPRDSFVEALEQLPKDGRAKLDAMVSDLTCITEVCGHLVGRLKEVKEIESRIIDLKKFEKEIPEMPELLRQIAITLAERLNSGIQGCTKLSGQVEEAIKAIDTISLSAVSK
jgi:hypothetical protein